MATRRQWRGILAGPAPTSVVEAEATIIKERGNARYWAHHRKEIGGLFGAWRKESQGEDEAKVARWEVRRLRDRQRTAYEERRQLRKAFNDFFEETIRRLTVEGQAAGAGGSIPPTAVSQRLQFLLPVLEPWERWLALVLQLMSEWVLAFAVTSAFVESASAQSGSPRFVLTLIGAAGISASFLALAHILGLVCGRVENAIKRRKAFKVAVMLVLLLTLLGGVAAIAFTRVSVLQANEAGTDARAEEIIHNIAWPVVGLIQLTIVAASFATGYAATTFFQDEIRRAEKDFEKATRELKTAERDYKNARKTRNEGVASARVILQGFPATLHRSEAETRSEVVAEALRRHGKHLTDEQVAIVRKVGQSPILTDDELLTLVDSYSTAREAFGESEDEGDSV